MNVTLPSNRLAVDGPGERDGFGFEGFDALAGGSEETEFGQVFFDPDEIECGRQYPLVGFQPPLHKFQICRGGRRFFLLAGMIFGLQGFGSQRSLPSQ